MFKENRIIFIEIVPPYRRKGRGMEVYRPPRKFKETLSGKLEKIEREMSQTEAQRVLEALDEFGEIVCPKCKSKMIVEDDSDPKLYKFKCLDCGYKWQWPRQDDKKKNGPKS